jgi:hypothetical protein
LLLPFSLTLSTREREPNEEDEDDEKDEEDAG